MEFREFVMCAALDDIRDWIFRKAARPTTYGFGIPVELQTFLLIGVDIWEVAAPVIIFSSFARTRVHE